MIRASAWGGANNVTDQLPFEPSPDAHVWRLSRREAAVSERERQVALRGQELASRDVARQRAEAALGSEQERVAELESLVVALNARIAGLEKALVERTDSLRRAQDETEGLRTRLGRMTRRDEQRRPKLAAASASSRGARTDKSVALTPANASSATQRWIPIDARMPRWPRA
jgi:chromosome segregation ATPase